MLDVIYSQHPTLTLAVVSLGLIVIYAVSAAFYNVFMHPLRHIPGPKIYAATRLPYARHHLLGTVPQLQRELHDKYGEVVRFTPNEVSFISGETAWQDIYGFRTGKLKGHPNMAKDMSWFPRPLNGAHGIFTAPDADHNRARRSLSHAFSAKALAAQEEILQGYADLLTDQLHNALTKSSGSIDIVQWYNWTTFDVISDLLFGESFGNLQNLSTHKHVQLLLKSVRSIRLSYITWYYPFFNYIASLMIDAKELRLRQDFFAWVKQQVDNRVARETERPDFVTYVMQDKEFGKGCAIDELHTSASGLLGAGTETTASTLSAATFLLCKNEAAYARLKAEVRGLWSDSGDITVSAAASQAPYLNAVIHEALRVFPPVATGFPRKVGAGGEVISGHYIPEGMSVSVSQDPTYNSARNFVDPEAFVPERWLNEDSRYANDKLDWVQPFSYGPRNCLGKNLAYAELRLFLAKLVWKFDFTLSPQSANWLAETKFMFVRVKPELFVEVKEAVHS